MYSIKIKGLKEIENAIRKNPKVVFDELSKGVKTSVHIIRPIMRQEAPIGKTHKLSQHISANARGLRGEVGPDLNITPYAWYVHEGTNPYVIRPKQKKALYWNGAPHPFKLIHHPGLKGDPFVERTFNRIEKPVQQIFNKSIANIIKRFHNGT